MIRPVRIVTCGDAAVYNGGHSATDICDFGYYRPGVAANGRAEASNGRELDHMKVISRLTFATARALYLLGFRAVAKLTLCETHRTKRLSFKHMTKTPKETEEHRHRAMLINNSLGEEYRTWYGWPEHTTFGRYLALGEYIVELCEEPGHDEWFDAAKEAYLKWKAERGYKNTPPPSHTA